MSPNDDYSGEPGGPIAYMASNGVAANLLMFALLGAGLVSLTGLEREAWPSVPFNHVEVSMAYPGAASVRIEVESGTDMRQAIDDIESAVVRLSDIAEVHDEFQDIDLIIRHQNQPAAFVEVYRVEGEQVMDVATAVHEHIAEVIIPSLPDGVVAAIRGARRIKVPLTFAVLTSIAGAIFADDDPDKDDLEENFSDPGKFDIDRFVPPAPPTSWCRALQDRTLLVLSGQPTGALTTAGRAPIIAPLHTADGKDNGQVSVSNELYPGGRCGSDQGRRYRAPGGAPADRGGVGRHA